MTVREFTMNTTRRSPPEKALCSAHPGAPMMELASSEAEDDPLSVRITLSICEGCRSRKIDRSLRISLEVWSDKLGSSPALEYGRTFESAKDVQEWLKFIGHKMAGVFFFPKDYEDRRVFHNGTLTALFFRAQFGKIEKALEEEISFSST